MSKRNRKSDSGAMSSHFSNRIKYVDFYGWFAKEQSERPPIDRTLKRIRSACAAGRKKKVSLAGEPK